jgi:hypothetical protein
MTVQSPQGPNRLQGTGIDSNPSLQQSGSSNSTFKSDAMKRFAEMHTTIKHIKNSESMRVLKDTLFGLTAPLLLPVMAAKAMFAAGANAFKKCAEAKTAETLKKAEIPNKTAVSNNKPVATPVVITPEKQARINEVVDELKDRIASREGKVKDLKEEIKDLSTSKYTTPSHAKLTTEINEKNIRRKEAQIAGYKEKIEVLKASPAEIAETARAAKAIPAKLPREKRTAIESLQNKIQRHEEHAYYLKVKIEEFKNDGNQSTHQEKENQNLLIRQEAKIAVANKRIVDILKS